MSQAELQKSALEVLNKIASDSSVTEVIRVEAAKAILEYLKGA